MFSFLLEVNCNSYYNSPHKRLVNIILKNPSNCKVFHLDLALKTVKDTNSHPILPVQQFPVVSAPVSSAAHWCGPQYFSLQPEACSP